MMQTTRLLFFMLVLLNWKQRCAETVEANGNAFDVDINEWMLEGWIYGENRILRFRDLKDRIIQFSTVHSSSRTVSLDGSRRNRFWSWYHLV